MFQELRVRPVVTITLWRKHLQQLTWMVNGDSKDSRETPRGLDWPSLPSHHAVF